MRLTGRGRTRPTDIVRRVGVRKSGQAQREAKVLVAARELFTTQGYEATSMRQIAERAGVSVGTVANTGDKATLLTKVFGEAENIAFLGRIARMEARSAGEGDFADDVDTMFGPWYESTGRQPDLVRAFLLDGLLLPDPKRSEQRRTRDAAMVDAICLRLLALHPSLDHRRAQNISYAAYSAHAVALIAAAIGNLALDDAREQARAAVSTICDQL